MAIIFQNDFDDSADTYTDSTVPTGWSHWYAGTEIQATVGGVTHYSGEVGYPGRGGTGKCLRMWRAGDNFEEYNGALHTGTFSSHPSNIYIRWTMRLSSDTAWDYSNAGSNYLKMWRLNTIGGGGEIYLNMNVQGGNLFPDHATLQILANEWDTILDASETSTLFDDKWHCYEVHLGTATDTLEFWLDGTLKFQKTDWNISSQTADFMQHFGLGNRASGTEAQAGWASWDFDDLVIADAYIGPPEGMSQYFAETFEDTSFAARGWYDGDTGTIDTTYYHEGAGSLRGTYLEDGTSFTAPKRHKFTESDSVYISYRVRYSSNFVGSGLSYHPHEFYFLTNLNGDYDGLAFDYLTVYLESHWDSSSSGYMQTGWQDGENIDQTEIGTNLIGVTENRGTAGCNGLPNGYSGICYDRGDGTYVNGVLIETDELFTTGNKTNWNQVEAYFQLNTISGSVGQQDGIIRIWFNGTQVLNKTDVLFRTNQRATMKFNQLIFAPWIGDGSPVEQSMWVDDLRIGASRETASLLSGPTNVRWRPA